MLRGEFLWEGPRPSNLLWKKMLKLYRPQKEKGKVLKILTIADLLKSQAWLVKKGLFSFSNGQIFFKKGMLQKVCFHCSWDSYLVNKGLGLFKLREVCQLKGVGFSGLELFGPLKKGGEASVSSLKECLSVIESLKTLFKRRGDGLASLELSHFHPSLEIVEKELNNETEKFVFNGLSQTDLAFQQKLFAELKGEVPLRIKAVLPYNHSYSSELFKSS